MYRVSIFDGVFRVSKGEYGKFCTKMQIELVEMSNTEQRNNQPTQRKVFKIANVQTKANATYARVNSAPDRTMRTL